MVAKAAASQGVRHGLLSQPFDWPGARRWRTAQMQSASL